MVNVWLDAVVLLRVGASVCTGVVLEPDRVIATAYHCVATGLQPEVVLRDGRTFEGRTIARDRAHDLALVTVDGEIGPGLSLRFDEPVLGERVYGLGHPYPTLTGGKLEGLLQWSVTEGIVSAVGPWLIQTDAALNPGNSGGPLVDTEGGVIGIASGKLDAEDIAFCAKAKDVQALRDSPSMGSPIGGTWGAAFGLVQANNTSVGGELFAVVRERVVTRAWVGYEIGGAGLVSLTTLAVRQRLGRGMWSTTFDVGGGGWFGSTIDPVVTGQVSVLSLRFGAMWAPITGGWSGTVTVEWPGVIGQF